MVGKPFVPRSYLVPSLFLTIALLLVGMLVWLSWRLIQQDQALAHQRVQLRLENAADAIIAALESRISQTERRVAELLDAQDSASTEAAVFYSKGLGDDALIVVAAIQSLEAYPVDSFRYYPALPVPPEVDPVAFQRGEVFEFQENDLGRAKDEYEALSSDNLPTQAGALVRLGRVFRKRHQPERALDVYGELAEIGPTHVGGFPADLLGHHGRCCVLAELERYTELRTEAHLLRSGLRENRWKLTCGAYHYFEQQSRGWTGPDPVPTGNLPSSERRALAMSAGVDWVWQHWQRLQRREADRVGCRILWPQKMSLLVIWRAKENRLVALLACSSFIHDRWLATVSTLLQRQDLHIGLVDSDGRMILGQPSGKKEHVVVRSLAQANLPCSLQVTCTDRSPIVAEVSGRRRLLLIGLGTIILSLSVASYFMVRSIARELAVARLQSSFVSAVSHEFRTPLATLCQLSELLADGRVSSDERRNEYYQALRRESQRLRLLVEGLLDFSRMEAGVRVYQFTPLDATKLAQDVAEAFDLEVRDRGYTVQIDVKTPLSFVRADREAIGRALWNLLDNAVKYSPECRTVWMDASSDEQDVVISIRDRGMGIPAEEQQKICTKFYRSPRAIDTGVGGTGLGLAMVQQIVSAHAGRLEIKSQPHEGSTFTIRLPCLRNQS